MPARVLHDYAKYHGLGNDYLVLDPARFAARASMTGAGLPAETVRLLCDRNRGVGADGVLWGPLRTPDGTPGLRIFNPDGSEAEKSGNGLRIFARYLWERRQVSGRAPFPILTPAGKVQAEVKDERGSIVAVAIGRVSFNSVDIPMLGPPRDVVNESLEVGGEHVTVCGVNVGNPHCVVVDRNPSPALAQRLGPLIEKLPQFPNRANVQFMRARDRRSIEIQIWERGAGYTLASGTSACAAAAAAVRIGLAEWPVTVHMPGGALTVANVPSMGLMLTGPVAAVSEGDFSPELLAHLHLTRAAGTPAAARTSAQRGPKARPKTKPARKAKPPAKKLVKKPPRRAARKTAKKASKAAKRGGKKARR
jgi:diaminopimelate epimerase